MRKNTSEADQAARLIRWRDRCSLSLCIASSLFFLENYKWVIFPDLELPSFASSIDFRLSDVWRNTLSYLSFSFCVALTGVSHLLKL